MAGLVKAIQTPLGVVLMLVVAAVLSGLTIASIISGELTAAVVSAAGFLVIIFIVAMVNYIGK